MPEVSYSTTINRPISEVFRAASDFDAKPQWQPDVISAHQTEDRVRTGVMVTQNRSTRLFGWRLDFNADIVGYQPNKVVEYKGVLGRFPITGRLEFAPNGGSTVVTETMDIRMGFLYGLFSPFMRSTMQTRTRRALENLKTMLESRSTGTAAPTDFHQTL
ncbi:MAG: hypothetical protein OHK0046_20440 [Anaerolineae bacterium]